MGALASAPHRAQVSIEPGEQDRLNGFNGQGVPGLEYLVMFVGRPHPEQVEEWPLRQLVRNLEVVTPGQQQRRDAHARREMLWVDLRSSAGPQAGALKDAGFEPRFHGREEDAGASAGTDAIKSESIPINVRPRLQVVKGASEIARPRHPQFTFGVRTRRGRTGPLV